MEGTGQARRRPGECQGADGQAVSEQVAPSHGSSGVDFDLGFAAQAETDLVAEERGPIVVVADRLVVTELFLPWRKTARTRVAGWVP